LAIVVDQVTLGTPTVQDSAGTTVAITTTVAAASNGFITGFVTWYDGVGGTQTLSTVAGGGLIWFIAFQFKAANGANVAIVYAQAPSGLAIGAAITATYSASVPAGRSIALASWTGVKTTAPVDGTPPAGTTGSAATAWTTGSMLVQAGSLALGMSMQITTNLSSIPTAPSLELFDFTSGVGGFSSTGAYRIETSVGTVTVAGAWSANASSATIGVAFLAAPPDYRSTVLADNPVLYWRLGEAPGATTAADSSPNNRPGTYSGSPTLGVPGLIVNDPNTAATLARASAQSVFRANESSNGRPVLSDCHEERVDERDLCNRSEQPVGNRSDPVAHSDDRAYRPDQHFYSCGRSRRAYRLHLRRGKHGDIYQRRAGRNKHGEDRGDSHLNGSVHGRIVG
jgi:hypothetical protein